MGGRKSQLNQLTKQIWEWCKDRNIWISVYHIPSADNFVADRLSRNNDLELMLCDEVFQIIQTRLGTCDIDLFVSRNNCKLPNFVSYKPDPVAFAVNAFSLSWTNLKHIFFLPSV